MYDKRKIYHYLMKIAKLSQKISRLKCNKFKYKEEKNSVKNIATNKGVEQILQEKKKKTK